jgi:3-hydroxyisobutyrate dehydrogenase-like beta-hydroxyacid dehydrogenase
MSAASQSAGIVGLGLMGSACATRLADAGFELLGYDVDSARRAAFSGERRRPVAALAELAACDVVVLAVFDTAQVEAVIEGDAGLLGCVRPGAAAPVVICTSTCDPGRIAALAGRCEAAGLAFVEMPISGTSGSLALGDAVGLVGGPAVHVERAAPALRALCPRRFELGAAGNGGKAKLAVNLVLGLNRAAMAEGLVFAERLGLVPEAFLEVLAGSAAYSRVMDVKGPMMAARRFEPLQSRVDQSLKDFHLILEQAALQHQALPFAEVYADMMEDCMARGEAAADNAMIVEAIARQRH